MAKPRKMSDAQKLRILERQRAKHAAALARVAAKIEQCETCSTDRLQRDLGRLDADYQRDRKALESKYGVTLPSAAKKKTAKKKTAKKKTAKKKTAKKTAKANGKSGKSRAKKTAKKAAKAPSAKKSGKKRGKKTPPRSNGGFAIDLFEDPKSRKPSWSGPVAEYLNDNDYDDDLVAEIMSMKPGQAMLVDLGAGGIHKIRRAKSEYRG